MEFNQSANTLIFSKIPAFFNKSFFENFLKNEKIAFNDIQIVIGDNYLPSKLRIIK